MKISNRRRQSQNCLCEVGENTDLERRPITEDNLAILGHEIRNPLSALSYALQVWPACNEDPQLTEDLLQIMRRQVKQLTRLSNDLLDAGKSRQGNLSLCRTAIDVRKSLQNACEEIRPFAERCGHTMTLDIGYTPLRLLGDESRLTQVFANLLHNSSKFTDRGGHLHVSLVRDNDEAEVRIRDNGRGICSDRLKALFLEEKSPKVCSENVGEGLGIGLRLAKSIVELHGGSIEVLSDGLGHGCTFVVRLPIITGIRSDRIDPSLLPTSKCQELDSRLPSYRIVVVDDDRSMRFLMSQLLNKLHQSVTVADNGDNALEAIHRTRPNVVFLDLQMHGMSGYEVARQIRRHDELQGVVLIALSGNTDAASRKLANEAGFNHYLVKPTSIAELTETLLQIEEQPKCLP